MIHTEPLSLLSRLYSIEIAASYLGQRCSFKLNSKLRIHKRVDGRCFERCSKCLWLRLVTELTMASSAPGVTVVDKYRCPPATRSWPMTRSTFDPRAYLRMWVNGRVDPAVHQALVFRTEKKSSHGPVASRRASGHRDASPTSAQVHAENTRSHGTDPVNGALGACTGACRLSAAWN